MAPRAVAPFSPIALLVAVCLVASGACSPKGEDAAGKGKGTTRTTTAETKTGVPILQFHVTGINDNGTKGPDEATVAAVKATLDLWLAAAVVGPLHSGKPAGDLSPVFTAAALDRLNDPSVRATFVARPAAPATTSIRARRPTPRCRRWRARRGRGADSGPHHREDQSGGPRWTSTSCTRARSCSARSGRGRSSRSPSPRAATRVTRCRRREGNDAVRPAPPGRDRYRRGRRPIARPWWTSTSNAAPTSPSTRSRTHFTPQPMVRRSSSSSSAHDGRAGLEGTRGDASTSSASNPRPTPRRSSTSRVTRGCPWPGFGMDKINGAYLGRVAEAGRDGGGLTGVSFSFVIETNFDGSKRSSTRLRHPRRRALPRVRQGLGRRLPTWAHPLLGPGALSYARNRHIPAATSPAPQSGWLLIAGLERAREVAQSPFGTMRLLGLMARHTHYEGVGLHELYQLTTSASASIRPTSATSPCPLGSAWRARPASSSPPPAPRVVRRLPRRRRPPEPLTAGFREIGTRIPSAYLRKSSECVLDEA